MAKYDKANQEQTELLQRTIQEYHQRLGDISIALLVAISEIDEETGEAIGPVLKHRGIPAYGITRIMPLKMRAHGLADALEAVG